MDKEICILIADDHALLRGGLRAVIQNEPGMRLVAEASNGVEAVDQFRKNKPDVVIMDLVMPQKDGIEAIHDILREQPEARILVLTSFSDFTKVFMAVKSGAQGYILKNTPPDELINAIWHVSRGGVWIQPPVMQQLLSQFEPAGMEIHPDPISGETREEPLTERECEILKLVARGLGNDEIAAHLVISSNTVGVHISHILAKLNLANRTQAALFALRRGMVGLFPAE